MSGVVDMKSYLKGDPPQRAGAPYVPALVLWLAFYNVHCSIYELTELQESQVKPDSHGMSVTSTSQKRGLAAAI